MSGTNDHPPRPQPTQKSNITLHSILSKDKLTCPNYMDWM